VFKQLDHLQGFAKLTAGFLERPPGIAIIEAINSQTIAIVTDKGAAPVWRRTGLQALQNR
jgi:hypothetical protein